MNLQTKKELLRYKCINNHIDYAPEITHILYWAKMDSEIDRINELSFSYEVEVEDNEVTCYQFLKYTTEFIRCMRHFFYKMNNLNTILTEIIENSKEEFNYLLDYKTENPYFIYDLKGNKDIKERIYKLIIASFVKNAKYVPSIREVLELNHIELKNIKDYDYKESKKIIQILSDIVFCHRGMGDLSLLFEDIGKKKTAYIERQKQNNRLKSTIEEAEQKYINDYIKQYNRIILSYNTRKKYIKYFVQSK